MKLNEISTVKLTATGHESTHVDAVANKCMVPSAAINVGEGFTFISIGFKL